MVELLRFFFRVWVTIPGLKSIQSRCELDLAQKSGMIPSSAIICFENTGKVIVENISNYSRISGKGFVVALSLTERCAIEEFLVNTFIKSVQVGTFHQTKFGLYLSLLDCLTRPLSKLSVLVQIIFSSCHLPLLPIFQFRFVD